MFFSQCPPPVNYIQPTAYYADYNITYPKRDLPTYTVLIKDTPISFSISPYKMFTPVVTNSPFSLSFTQSILLDTTPYTVVCYFHGELLKTSYSLLDSQNSDFISYLNSAIATEYPNLTYTIEHYTNSIYNYSLSDISHQLNIVDDFQTSSFYTSYGTVPYYPVRVRFSNGNFLGFSVPVPDSFLPSDYPLDTDITNPSPPNYDDGILSWLYNIGGAALESSNLINSILTFEVAGVNLFYILFGGGFLIYAGWVVIKWFLPT